jgi:hypothetical protein
MPMEIQVLVAIMTSLPVDGDVLFVVSQSRPSFLVRDLSLNTSYYQISNMSNTTYTTSGAGTTYPSWAPEFCTRFFSGSSFCTIF